MPRLLLSAVDSLFQAARIPYRVLRKIRKPVSPFFHWNYSGGVGFAIFLAGIVTLMTTNSYPFAKWMIGIGGLWVTGWWLVSEPLLVKRPHDSCAARQLWNAHRRREWIPIIFGLIVLLGLFKFTDASELAYQQNEVFNKLSITYSEPPNNNPLESFITIRNGGSFNISRRHRIACIVNLEVDSNGNPTARYISVMQSKQGWMLWGSSEIPRLGDYEAESEILSGGGWAIRLVHECDQA